LKSLLNFPSGKFKTPEGVLLQIIDNKATKEWCALSDDFRTLAFLNPKGTISELPETQSRRKPNKDALRAILTSFYMLFSSEL